MAPRARSSFTTRVNGSRVPARLAHGLLAAVVLASLVTQTVLTAQGAPDAAGVVQPAVTRFIRLFSYFTIQSNILLLIVSVTLAVNPDRDGRLWRVVRLDAVLGIIITGLVYATVLAGAAHPTGAGWWSNLGFHYVAPWWALLGWLLFGPRSRHGQPDTGVGGCLAGALDRLHTRTRRGDRLVPLPVHRRDPVGLSGGADQPGRRRPHRGSARCRAALPRHPSARPFVGPRGDGRRCSRAEFRYGIRTPQR